MADLPSGAKRFQKDILEWSRGNLREFPWREDNRSSYEVLIAEIFLKQTRASMVADIYPAFIDRFSKARQLTSANEAEIIQIIRPLGLYNRRAKALKTIGESVGGTGVPPVKEDLLKLPQVGPYVAKATLCFRFGERVPIVDSNIGRIYTRLFYSPTEDVDQGEIWNLAERMLPEDQVQRFNLALLDFGAKICTDPTPHCEKCFAQSYCSYYQNQS